MATTILPIPALIQLTIPDDGNTAGVEAEIRAMANRLDQEEEPAEKPPDPAEDPRFHVFYIPPGVHPYLDTQQLLRLPFSLEEEPLKAQMEREIHSIFILHGTDGVYRLANSLQISVDRYNAVLMQGGDSPLLPNAKQFDSWDKISAAGRKIYVAQDEARRLIAKQAEEALAAIEKAAIPIGKKRLDDVRPQILEETTNYIDYSIYPGDTPGQFLEDKDQASRAILRGPKVKELFEAIREIERDRRALEQAADQVAAKGIKAQADFETATKRLMTTVEVLCDDLPLLHRIWEKISLTRDVYYDPAQKRILGRTEAGGQSVARLNYYVFHTLRNSYLANVALTQSLSASDVWKLPPLVDLALEEIGEAGPTIAYRAAQERLAKEEEMSVASILGIVTGVLEMGGLFLAADPPVLLALAVASAVLSLIDNAQEYFSLRTKDQAYLASLDPQLSLSTEPSYFGFYVSVAFSLLDIKGVRDAMKTVRAARYGGELDEAVRAYTKGS